MALPNEPLDLSKLEQHDFYSLILERKPIPARMRLDCNITTIQMCIRDSFNISPTRENIWLAMKHRDLTRKTRDFLWKCVQNTYKVGDFWEKIPSYESRGTCPICNKREDLEHIIMKCKAKARSTTWHLAKKIWSRCHDSPLPDKLGDILGCGLTTFRMNNKINKGKNRLYRILISETAYLIWKMRNERRIRDGDSPGKEHSTKETFNRWKHTINKQLTTDRALTNKQRFGKRAINENLVKVTWRNCIANEDGLPSDWSRLKGALVGILIKCPTGL